MNPRVQQGQVAPKVWVVWMVSFVFYTHEDLSFRQCAVGGMEFDVGEEQRGELVSAADLWSLHCCSCFCSYWIKQLRVFS